MFSVLQKGIRMSEIGYNGWANYETWVVYLWLSNESSSDAYWCAAARDAVKTASKDPRVPKTWTEEQAGRFNLADRLKEELEEAQPSLGATLWADLLGAALMEVSWKEIAKAYIEAVKDIA